MLTLCLHRWSEVTTQVLDEDKAGYQHSAEERADLKAAYLIFRCMRSFRSRVWSSIQIPYYVGKCCSN